MERLVMNWKERLIRFMSGRNGMDALNRTLFWTYMILYVLNLFLKSSVIALICTFAAVYMLFRSFSRNLTARRSENMKFWSLRTKFLNACSRVGLLRSLGKYWKRLKSRIRNIGTKRYRVCPHCKAELCLPRRKGQHQVRCPRCTREFAVKILF